MRKAVFLDRDGVINKIFIKDNLPSSPPTFELLEILPGVEESILRLKKLNFACLVVTNQPDVGRNLISKNTLEKMHNKLKKKIHIDEIYVCTHIKDQNCFCRKPNPGMILDAAKKYQIDLKKSFLIGDRASDIEAGQEANCRSIFLDKKNYEKPPNKQEATFNNLTEATDYILEQDRLEDV